LGWWELIAGAMQLLVGLGAMISPKQLTLIIQIAVEIRASVLPEKI
jgi:hypothetical protein